MKLKDKVAIVTGGGRGIGKAICLAFTREGANIVVISRTKAEVEETGKQIEALGGRVLPLSADVSNWRDVENAVASTIKRFGMVDILVNCAGVIGPVGPVIDNDISHWAQTIHINLIGTFLCTKAVLPTMIEHGGGKIINFSGGGAVSSRPYFTAYAASKAAVVRFTESLAEEVKDFNIQVNAIAPGAVNTRMLDQLLAAGETAGEKESTKAREQLKGRGTPPEKAASLAIFLASEKSDGLSGRLISAVWDDWPNMGGQIGKIMNSDLYTLRRVIK